MTLLNLGPDDQYLFSLRVVSAGSDENTTYLRTLRPDEEDFEEAVQIPAGKKVVIRPGDLSISSDEVDARSPKGRGGYAPVSDTIWTWYRIMGAEDKGLLMLLLAAARKLDATHVFWADTMDALDESCTLTGIERRIILFRALALAEVTVISLSRGVEMLYKMAEKFDLGLEIPEKITSSRITLRQMRNAFEHIDDRAVGKVTDGSTDSPMSVFFQLHFVDQRILTYGDKSISFATGVPIALLECRKVIMSVIDLRPKLENTSPTNSEE